jgi:flagellar motor switch protein FliN/FliY
MPINPEYQNKIQKLGEVIAVEVSNKLSFLLNKNAKVTFKQVTNSSVVEGKFITKANCFLITSTLESPDLGSINVLITNQLVQCVADLIMGGEGVAEENVQPDETIQSVFENSASSIVDGIIARLNSFKEELGLTIKEHKQKQLLKNKSATLDVPKDLKDSIALKFEVKIPSRVDVAVDVELGSDLINHIAESLSEVVDSIDIKELEAKIKTEYFGENIPKIEEEEPTPVIEDDVDKEVNELRNFGFLTDINLDLIVELGRVQMSMKDILKLTKGSAIELDRTTNQPVDLYVHNQLVAKGEIVAVDDCFGLKVIEVLGKLDLRTAFK